MLPAITVVVLAASPTIHCNHCELRDASSAGQERLSSHALLAQAEVPPPPLPSAEVEGPSAVSSRSTQELELKISDLNREIRGIDVNWPAYLIVIAYAGYVIAPSALVMGGMGMVFGILGLAGGAGSYYFGGSAALAILGVSAAIFLVGVAGIAAIVYAWTTGNAKQQEARKRREGLIREREAAEAELKALRSDRDRGFVQPSGMITLLSF